jgi:hypothetical protein
MYRNFKTCGLQTQKQVGSNPKSHLIWVFLFIVICVSCDASLKANKMSEILIQSAKQIWQLQHGKLLIPQ